MRISTRTHAAMNYLIPLGVGVLAASGIFARPFRRVMTAGPFYHLAYTLFTKHEGGVVKAIPMREHLVLDTLGSLAFVAAGTLARREPAAQRWAMVLLGAAELATIAVSEDAARR
jgi:hypothetical protein